MKLKTLAALSGMLLGACGPIAMESANSPLDTPGDGRFIDYVNTDIHWRMFARDFGHPEREPELPAVPPEK